MNAAKIDLHLHLDGSLYLPWAWKTAVKRGVVEAGSTFEEYYSRFHRRNYLPGEIIRSEGALFFFVWKGFVMGYHPAKERTKCV